MTRKECYAALGLEQGADLAAVKRAYRRLAFSLHPDLNPDVPDAAQRFQRINEAYVFLSQNTGKPFDNEQADGSTARAREEASKAYKARQGKEDARASGKSSESSQSEDDDKESVLKDILNDPFARRVFEDIYSHIREEGKKKAARAQGAQARNSRTGARPASGAGGKSTRAQNAKDAAREDGVQENSLMGKVKGWLRRQIDDEQVLRLPGASLVPGARVRLEIQHGFSGEPQVVEITLPPEFKPGKAMRLKGMGKRLGSLKGDLYVRIEPV